MRDGEITAPIQGRETAIPPRRPREEAIRLGKEIYERDVLRWTQSVGQNRGHVKSGSCCLKRLQ